MSRITQKFYDICKIKSDDIAVVYSRKNKMIKKTYKDLYGDFINVRQYLLKLGVKKGDRILTLTNDSYQLCLYMMAIISLGATVMYVNILARQETLRNIFNRFCPKYVLLSNKTKILKLLIKPINEIENIINIDKIDKYKEEQKNNIEFDEIDEKEIALLTMTTGSSGTPKIAIRTHEDLHNQLELIDNNINKINDDEYILTTSFMYVFANIVNGYSTIIPDINLKSKNIKKLNKKLEVFKNLNISTIITSPDFALYTKNIFIKDRKSVV